MSNRRGGIPGGAAVGIVLCPSAPQMAYGAPMPREDTRRGEPRAQGAPLACPAMRITRPLALALAVAAGAGCTNPSPVNDQPLIEDQACSQAAAEATGRLTNRSRTTHSFTVLVAFRDQTGGTYANAEAAIDNLPPGESVAWRARSGAQLAPGGSCEVVSVQTLPIV